MYSIENVSNMWNFTQLEPLPSPSLYAPVRRLMAAWTEKEWGIWKSSVFPIAGSHNFRNRSIGSCYFLMHPKPKQHIATLFCFVIQVVEEEEWGVEPEWQLSLTDTKVNPNALILGNVARTRLSFILKGAVSPIIPSAPKCCSCHFIFHRKCVCFE